jgi:hypothetical protein
VRGVPFKSDELAAAIEDVITHEHS